MKIIHDDKGTTTISNDGATIMKLLDVVHPDPAAKILVDIAKSQDSETDSMDMKIRELLKEVHLVDLDYSFAKTLDGVISSVVDAIKSIPDQEVCSKDARKFIRYLRVPTSKANFMFRAPEFVQVGGSHSIRAIVKPNIIVDLLVRMPKDCFHEKDYLNHRYHAKRCLYMQVIEKSLKSSPLVRKIEWTTFQNEARKPVLLLYPVMKDSGLSEFYIKLIPTATSLFNPSKMKLSRNNLRALNQEGDTTHASPKYNSSILEDMFLEENAEFIRKVFHEWKSLEEALVLLKVWARNRSSIFTHDCLSGYLISIIMAYLAVGSGENRITKSMNTMQIFRVTLKNLSSSMWNRGIYLKPPSQCDLSKEDMAQFLDSMGVAFCDVSGHVNLTFRMTRSALSELQDEAAWTLSCIDKYKDGGFEAIFMTKVDFAARFDSCIRINFEGNTKVYSSDLCLDAECWRTCERDVHSHLQQALTDRAKLVRVTWRTTPTNWNIQDGMSGFGKEPMIVGILFSSHEQSFRVVDVGPNAENKEEVIKFRKFWGEKSELRRFRDGTIAESTVWECEPWERHLIIKRITDYILMKHFLLAMEDIVHISDQLDFVLHLRGKDPVSFSRSLFGAFEILSKRLRLLDEIPLKISSVQPLDPAFRHTSVFPPEPHPLAFQKGKIIPKFVATCLQPVEVMLQLEGSGNWPLDSVAIEKTKSAFLLKIGESLQKCWGNFCIATEDNVDVLMSGYAFRLKILHERGLNLMKTQVNDIASVDKDLFLRGQHSGMINGLHGRYPIYGPVARLAKRWVSAHLFSSFLKEEAVELIVAYLFLKPFPFHAPCSRVTGFLRFLRLLSNYDWTFTPLIVDINGDFTSKDEKDINDTFILSRKKYEENSQDIEPAMFLATTYDKVSEAWTIFSPNRLVLKRMASYARSSADLLTNLILQGDTGSSYTWECLVRTPLNNYDAIVLLHREKLCYHQRLLFPTEIDHGKHVILGKPSKDFHPYMAFANAFGSLEEARTKLMVDFDPTNYFLEDLKAEFPDTFKVWYDSLGGDAIGLTWEKKGAKKRNRDDGEETRDPVDILKYVGKVGKGYVKSVYLVKNSKDRAMI